jgi:hypothetical protein
VDDLFVASASPAKVPAYGALSYAQEFSLYLSDRSAWTRYVAPHYVELMAGSREWAVWVWPQLARDLQGAVWALLDESTRAFVRAARTAAPSASSVASATS